MEQIVTEGTSVVICTFNGASRIETVLRSLSSCATTGPAEIVVVDNRSTDDVGAVAQSVWRHYGRSDVALRVIRESTPGLAFARRAGVLAARHSLIVFCDDDNLLSPTYLTTALEMMADQSIGALGGAGTPVFEQTPSPEFFNFAGYFAVGAQLRSIEDVQKEIVELGDSAHSCLYGAGLVMRRADLVTLYQLPFFPVASGRKGGELTSHDDYEMCHLIRLAGKRLVYTRRLQFKHLMPSDRLEHGSICRQLRGTQTSRPTIFRYVALRQLQAMSRVAVLREVTKFVVGACVGRDNRHRRFLVCAALQWKSAMNFDERRVFENYRALCRVKRKTSHAAVNEFARELRTVG